MAQQLTQIALTVLDYDDSIAFYVNTLGWELLEDTDRGGGKRWVRVRPRGSEPGDDGRDDAGAGLLLAKAVTPEQIASVGNQTGGRVFIFVHTDNIARDAAELKARGVEFIREPTKADFGTAAVFEDLYGNLVDLIEVA